VVLDIDETTGLARGVTRMTVPDTVDS